MLLNSRFLGPLGEKMVSEEFERKKKELMTCSLCGVNRLNTPCPKGTDAVLLGHCPINGTPHEIKTS